MTWRVFLKIFENIMLGDRSQAQKVTYCVWSHVYEMSRIDKCKETDAHWWLPGVAALWRNSLVVRSFTSEWWDYFGTRESLPHNIVCNELLIFKLSNLVRFDMYVPIYCHSQDSEHIHCLPVFSSCPFLSHSSSPSHPQVGSHYSAFCQYKLVFIFQNFI